MIIPQCRKFMKIVWRSPLRLRFADVHPFQAWSWQLTKNVATTVLTTHKAWCLRPSVTTVRTLLSTGSSRSVPIRILFSPGTNSTLRWLHKVFPMTWDRQLDQHCVMPTGVSLKRSLCHSPVMPPWAWLNIRRVWKCPRSCTNPGKCPKYRTNPRKALDESKWYCRGHMTAFSSLVQQIAKCCQCLFSFVFHFLAIDIKRTWPVAPGERDRQTGAGTSSWYEHGPCSGQNRDWPAHLYHLCRGNDLHPAGTAGFAGDPLAKPWVINSGFTASRGGGCWFVSRDSRGWSLGHKMSQVTCRRLEVRYG